MAVKSKISAWVDSTLLAAARALSADRPLSNVLEDALVLWKRCETTRRLVAGYLCVPLTDDERSLAAHHSSFSELLADEVDYRADYADLLSGQA